MSVRWKVDDTNRVEHSDGLSKKTSIIKCQVIEDAVKVIYELPRYDVTASLSYLSALDGRRNENGNWPIRRWLCNHSRVPSHSALSFMAYSEILYLRTFINITNFLTVRDPTTSYLLGLIACCWLLSPYLSVPCVTHM